MIDTKLVGAIAAVLIFCIVTGECNPIEKVEVSQTNLLKLQNKVDNPNIHEFVRSKRHAHNNLQGYRDKLLQLLNEYRQEKYLPLFVVDHVLEQGAQEWAEEETTTLAMAHSCENCENYGEILGKRRSSQPIPEGAEAGDWTYESLFGDEERTYAEITDDAEILNVGFGIAFIRNPEDKTYHAYVVARFARAPHHFH